MSILNSIIKSLTKEEVRAYKLYAKRTNDHGDRKDLQLFDLLKQYPKKEEVEFSKCVLGSAVLTPGYYKLKNRIADDLALVLINLNHKGRVVNYLHNITLAKIVYQKKAVKTAIHYLSVAERQALEIEDYSALGIIYDLLLQYSMELDGYNPEELIKKHNENALRLKILQELKNNFVMLTYQLKHTQNFIVTKKLDQWLKSTISNVKNLPYIKNSITLRIKTIQTFIRLLVLVKDYKALKKYLEETLFEFENESLFNEANHAIKL